MDSPSFVPSLQKPSKTRRERRLIAACLSHLDRVQSQAKRGAKGMWQTGQKSSTPLVSQMFILIKFTFDLCLYLLCIDMTQCLQGLMFC